MFNNHKCDNDNRWLPAYLTTCTQRTNHIYASNFPMLDATTELCSDNLHLYYTQHFEQGCAAHFITTCSLQGIFGTHCIRLD